MNLSKVTGKFGLTAIVMLVSSCALADESGWYVGANVGQSKAAIDDSRITNGLLSDGFTTTSITDEDRDLGYKIFGGYQFNKNFALEGGYFDLGKFGFKATTQPPGTLNGDIRLRGLNLDVIGSLPITEKFSVFARLGANYAQASDSFTGTGSVNVLNSNPSKFETNPKVGLGLEYAFSDTLAMRAEVERYRINDAVGNRGDINLVTVGFVYRFGSKPQAPTPRAVASIPVEVAPAPIVLTVVPEPVVVPAPLPPVKVTFSADSLFDFNKANINPVGQQALDKFSSDLKDVNYDVIKVTGHTDRIGSHAYNLKLSTRRAEAISAYLVTSAGIPAEKINALGVDGTDPVTKPGDCEGKRVSKELIKCLQPDRRVDIEVIGTK